ncbi:outer membrane lipoprotein carrier protein [Nitrosomonas cryotolerans]|uniref:Outer-membrane lipoprotein carrier protein n=1 Tax=Nitrosomonas cryotolerans ATCC 49181 TaxID=1131553 RepID=A0A1N6FQK9_9PROT|nr:outer membrane lipoprotein chaperone LolA [Nitrosomonas cryotolerans]SFP94401.1 outer membrane lipoprotein carrier protein [Nitrosomonas cryotolerans]SIN97553.1 outer membrane lipoprotein carrier protein [Nitrosomonas cryotolerans ATCC 49181]
MNRLSCNFFFFFLIYLLPVLVHAAALDSLKTFIQETRTARATFSQILLDRNSKIIQKSSGIMQFERPNKFRWTYEKPYEQLIVGDGIQVWFYDRDLNQVTIRTLDLAIGSSPAALLAGNSTIEANFSLTEMGQQDQLEWLEASPKNKESTFEFIQLGFSMKGSLKIMVLRDSFGQTTLLTFSNLDKNPNLPASLFHFIPPDGSDVISD